MLTYRITGARSLPPLVVVVCLPALFSDLLLANQEEAAAAQSAAEAVSDVPRQLTAIPRESGFSGSVILGGSYAWLESNMVAGNDFGDVGRERIDSIFDEPDSESDVIPAVSADLRYTFALGSHHTLSPSLKYTLFDLDGGAMKNDGLSVQVTHMYDRDRFTLVSNLFLGYADYDKRNPIYGKTREDDDYGLTVTAFWHQPFGWRDWSLLGSAAYAKSDSNIDFYDAQGFIGTGGVLYRF